MTLRSKQTSLCALALILAGSALASNRPGPSAPEADSSALRRTALQHRRGALELELALIRSGRADRYLVIDLPAREVHLKSEAHLLRTCPVQGYRLVSRHLQQLRMVSRVDPVTPEPGNSGLRLRGRRFPLDFSGRLIEGPREASRLYFTPSLLIQPVGLPPPPNVSYLELKATDIKSLGSALKRGDAAVLIPSPSFQPRSETSP